MGREMVPMCILLGGTEHWSQRWDGALLEDIIVSLQAAATFCDRTDTSPPLAMQRGWLGRFIERRRGRQNRFPPPCADAERRAIACSDNVTDEGSLLGLRTMLAQMQRKPHPFSVWQADPTLGTMPADLVNWTERWEKARDSARQAIDLTARDDLRSALAAVDADWFTFMQSEKAASESRALALTASASDAGEVSEKPPSARLRINCGQRVVFVDGRERKLSQQLLT